MQLDWNEEDRILTLKYKEAIMKNFLKCFLLISSLFLLQVGNMLGYMSGRVVNLNAGGNILADSDFIGKEKIVMTCKETFSGNGHLEAPVISITAKKFAFTGTIKCDVTCTITVKEKFNPKMFKRQGKGTFIITVNPDLVSCPSPAVEPAVINVCGTDFTLKNQAALDLADAIEKGDIDELREIIEDNPDLKNNKDTLAIFMVIAGHYNQMDAVKELISFGADINSENITLKGQHPLLFAMMLKNPDFVRVLVQAGANPNESEIISMIPLIIYAVINGGINCLIELLKAENINIDETDIVNSWTALIAAAYCGKKEMVRALLEAGADPALRGFPDYVTAIDYASSEGHQDIVEFIKQFQKKDTIKKDSGFTVSKPKPTHNTTIKKDDEQVSKNTISDDEQVGQKKSWISNIKPRHCLMTAVIICSGYIFLRNTFR